MKRRDSIQAVTLDVGGTLITPHPSVGAVYARVAARHHAPALPTAELDRRFLQAWEGSRPFGYSRDSWASLVDEVFDGLLPRPPSETFFGELYEEFTRASAWRLFDDVLPALESLAGHGLDLGIVSNWDERLRPLLGALRLDRYFNCLVISCEAGFPKPSPVIFQEALRQLGRPASAVLHVGDALREDFAGAMAAGLPALHLQRDAAPHDGQIRSLTEILPWILAH